METRTMQRWQMIVNICTCFQMVSTYTPPHYMNQTMIFLICVRSNEEDEINERQKINKKIKEREEFFISSDEETKKSRSEDTSLRAISTPLRIVRRKRMIYRINFHALHAPLRFRFAFSRGLFFPPSFSFTKKYPRPSTRNSSIRQYRIGSLVGRYGPVFEFNQRRPATSAMSTHVAAEKKGGEGERRRGWLCVSYLPLKIHCPLRRFPPGGVINGALGAPYGVASYTMEFIRT